MEVGRTDFHNFSIFPVGSPVGVIQMPTASSFQRTVKGVKQSCQVLDILQL